LERKYRAIDDFTRRLLSSEVGGSIAKIVLFGSLRKGRATPDSDIDLLVLTTDSLDEVIEACLESSFETSMETGELVEPMVYPVGALRYPPSYFAYYNLKTGKELYSMDEETLRREESLGYLELAEEYERASRNSLKAGDWRLAVDGAYNAAELCAKGLLILKLEDIPGSHKGVITKFGELFIKTGSLPKEMGRRLNKGLWLRNQARYERHARIGKEEAESMLDLAAEFIAALASELEK